MNGCQDGEEPVIGDFVSTAAFVRAFEKFHDQRTPSSGVILERATRLASESMRAVSMQLRRVGCTEPEDSEWMLRVVTDFQFLVVALWRLRTVAKIAESVDCARESVGLALAVFDQQLPDLTVMRHVAQHLDDYAVDHAKRRQRKPGSAVLIGRRSLEVCSWSEDQFRWLGGTIDLGQARTACESLYAAVCAARDTAAAPP